MPRGGGDGDRPAVGETDQRDVLHAAAAHEISHDRRHVVVFAAIEPLTTTDLEKKVTIRGQEHTVLEAISRQMTHYAEHVGQIILLAKHFRGAEWKSLSIPKGQSARLGTSAELTNRARRG